MRGAGSPCGNGPRTETPARDARSKHGNHDGGDGDGDQHAGDARPPFQHQNQRESAAADHERRDVGGARQHLVDDSHHLAQWSVRAHGEAEELRDLAHHHGQRDAVHVAVTDWFRQQLGNEAETREARSHAHHTGHDRHHSAKRDGALRVAARKRQHGCQDHSRERRVRSEDKNAARTEQRVREQRHDGRVEPVDPWQPGCLRIRNADRHEHRRHDETCDDVVSQPGRLILSKRAETGDPAHPAGTIRVRRRPGDTARHGAVRRRCFSHRQLRQKVQKNVTRNMESWRRPGKFVGSGSLAYLTSSRFGLSRTAGWRYHSPPTIHVVNGDCGLRSQ